MLHNPGTIALPIYNMTRHPIETWQEWYISNQAVIDIQVHITNQVDIYGASAVNDPAFEIRNIAPYEYIDSLNQRQIWEPYLTGRERQEFDTHLRRFMAQNRSASLRLRPAPIVPPSSDSTILKFRPLNNNSNHSSSHLPPSSSTTSSSSSSTSSRSKKSSHRHRHSSQSKSKPSSSNTPTVRSPKVSSTKSSSVDLTHNITGMSQFQVSPFDPAAASIQNAASSSYQSNSYQPYPTQSFSSNQTQSPNPSYPQN